MSRKKLALIAAAIFLFACASFAYLSRATIPVLEPAGPVALAERGVMFTTLALCAIVVIPVFFLLFYFAWKYRADSPEAHVHHRPDWDHDSKAAEFIWWLVPTAIVAILGVVAWNSSHALDPYKPLPGSVPAIPIDVVALDWKWLFIYPAQGIASVNLVEFPENTPVHFYLTADAPMNSFWIPQLAGQIMVMPGMTTQLNLAASRAGDFSGFSGNISGEGFAGMAFTARAVPEGEFEQWIASVEASSTPLTQGSYDSLAAPSEYNPVATYAPVDQGLFETILMNYMMPASEMAGMDMDDMDMNGVDASDTPAATSTP